MSSNKRVKQRLIELYGPECFIDKLKLRKYDKPIHYTSKGQKKRMEMLTYHHILEKSKRWQSNCRKWSFIISRKSRMVSPTAKKGT